MKLFRQLFLKFFLFAATGGLFLFISSCDKEEPVNNIIPPGQNDTTKQDSLPTSIVADSLRINQIQIIGSHNSYRLKTYQPIYDLAQSFKNVLPSNLNPDGWDYSHLPLDQQFENYGVRKIELDIYYDPSGGRFYNREGNALVGEAVESGIAELNQPGFKVLHIADMDYNTNYYTFKAALLAVKTWSDAHPRHLPIFILIEAKESGIGSALGVLSSNFADVLPFDETALDALDQEIKDVFGENLETVLTPDKVRGSSATLNEAITTEGWPRIGDCRGKVAFLFNNGGAVMNRYIQGHPSLTGRIMFVDAPIGTPESAFVMRNNSRSADISELVAQGYLIRTRADEDTQEARTGDVSKREAALASGAQIISTDYYRPDPRYLSDPQNWTDYHVSFPGNAVARLNPVNGPSDFKGGPIE